VCRVSGCVVTIALALAAPAAAQAPLPPVEDVPWPPLRARCQRLLKEMDGRLPPATAKELARLVDGRADPDGAAAAAQKLLDPLCLVGVHINPESRVKVARGPAAAELRLGQESRVLVKVHNEAGVTHPLKVSGPQLRPAKAGWLEAAVAGKALSGRKLDYVVLRLKPHEAGKREATLRFDVGQGTQDIGFRGEVPVLFAVRK